MDLERGGRRGRIAMLKRKKRGFAVLGKYNILCFFGTFSSFQPSMREIHEDLGWDFILEGTNKAFLEKGISHVLHSEGQVLKCGYKVFHCSQLFQLGQTT
jgi:hypothetical protein